MVAQPVVPEEEHGSQPSLEAGPPHFTDKKVQAPWPVSMSSRVARLFLGNRLGLRAVAEVKARRGFWDDAWRSGLSAPTSGGGNGPAPWAEVSLRGTAPLRACRSRVLDTVPFCFQESLWLVSHI